jgi:urease accessory protein
METSYAKAETTVRVDEDAYLEYVPDPTILHDGARYDTETHIRVTEGSAAVVSDIVVAGRLAHGEHFGFDAYRSSVTAREDDGILLFDDTTEITDADEDGRRRTVFDGNSVFGDVYVVAPGYAEETDETTEGLRDAVASAVEDETEDAVTAGVTALPNDAGVVLRFVADSVGEARRTKRAGWDAARRRLIGAPVPPRRR